MRPSMLLLLMSTAALLVSAVGCAPETAPDRVPLDDPIPLASQIPEPTSTAPAESASPVDAAAPGKGPADSPEPAPVAHQLTLLMNERPVVRFADITVAINDRQWRYRFVPSESTDTVWENILHVGYLRPWENDDRLPVMKCWLRRDTENNVLSIVVTTSKQLPDMRIRLEPADGLIPVRLRQDEIRPTLQSTLADTLLYDSFFDPAANCAYELQGRLLREFRTITDPHIGGFPRLWLELPASEDRRETLLTIQAHERVAPDWDTRTLQIPTTQPVSPLESWKVPPGSIWAQVPALPEPRAGWSDALLRGGSRSERLERNMNFLAAHFAPNEAGLIWSRGLRSSQKPALDELRLHDGEDVIPLQRNPAWMQRVRDAGSAWQRINEHAPDYNWQHVREYMQTFVAGYPGYGVTHTQAPPPMLIGEPLTVEHARMLVTMMGLSGRPVVLGDDLPDLSLERLAMLDHIVPPLPMRSPDLFETELPDVWCAQAGFVAGPHYVVGLFNWSPRRQSRTITLAGLGLPVHEQVHWGVYDVWHERIISVVRERFSLVVPPQSCRLMYLAPTTEIPMLMGDPRHITLLAREAGASLGSSDDALVWSGTSRVAPGEPKTLMWFVPPHSRYGEVTAVGSNAPSSIVLSDGPLWRVIFDPIDTTELTWQVRFTPSNRTVEPPSPPSQLVTQQNTRGVRLTWADMDDAAARYRVYRDGDPVADVPGHIQEYQDSDVVYNRTYLYSVTSINWADMESEPSLGVLHQTPIPISTNLTRLVPLWVEQKHLALREDQSVGGNAIRMAGRRYYHGLGTHSTSRIAYFLGDGYDQFSCHVGIDDETKGEGSAIFEVVLDGETVFTSRLLRGNDIPESFSISVTGHKLLELVTLPTDDGEDHDHADWGNPYLHVLAPPQPIDQPTPRRGATGYEYDPFEGND